MREPKLYTIMILPHSGSRMRTFALTKPFVVTAGLLIGLILLAGFSFPHWYLTKREMAVDMEALREHNATLAADLGQVDVEMARLRSQLNHYEHQARKFALMAGLEPLADQFEASGGPGEGEHAYSQNQALLDELGALTSREERLSQHFQVLDEAWQEREAYLGSVPSLTPVEGGYFGSNYGYRRDPFTGRRTFHRGQDIVANTGTPVRAPAGGRVTRAGRTGGLGIAIYVSHGNGIVSRFGHLSKLKVRAGQKVQRGDVIGYVGSTGRSMGPHLHYEVLVSGKHVDPRDFILEGAGRSAS